MKFVGSLVKGIGHLAGLAGKKTVTVVTYPVVKPAEILMQVAINNVLISVLKGVLATLAAALGAAAGVVPVSADPFTIAIWGVIVTGIHALQTFIQHTFIVKSETK